MNAAANSLEVFLQFMVQSNTDDVAIYQHLASLDRGRLKTLLKRLETVENAKPPTKGSGAKEFAGRRDSVKGRLYEQIIRVFVDGVKCFASWSNVSTTTNELDILIQLGPSAQFIPALRLWGTHCICECKYHS